MPAERRLALTFATTGVTAGPHLADMKRDAFTRAGCVPYRDLRKRKNGATVRVGGLMADGLRRPPTAKGTGFIRLEEADGIVDIILSADVLARQEIRDALQSAFIVVEGPLQKTPATLTVLAKRVEAVP